jgi:hypothetical protein
MIYSSAGENLRTFFSLFTHVGINVSTFKCYVKEIDVISDKTAKRILDFLLTNCQEMIYQLVCTNDLRIVY